MKHVESLLRAQIDNSRRDCLMLLLGLKLGPRASELLAIKKEDVNLDNKSIIIRGLKNSNDRELPVETSIFKQLVKYMSSVEGDMVFPISYERLVQIWNHWRPVKKSFHSLRHTMALNLYRRSHDIRLVQTALGHKSINSTMIYQTYVHTQKELRKVMT